MADANALTTLSAWVPAVGTTGAFAVVLWLARNLISNRLTKSVQHEFDIKLASIQSSLRQREAELEAIRRTALSTLASNQGVVDQRKMEAVDHLWGGLLSAKKLLWAVQVLATLKLEAICKELSDARMKSFLLAITKPLDAHTFPDEAAANAQRARPWVSPMSWAFYSAYQAVVAYCYGVLKALNSGVENPRSFFSRDKIVEILRSALPDVQISWEELPDSALPSLLELLELRLLAEIQKSIAGDQTDFETLARAKRITSLTCEVEIEERMRDIPSQPVFK